MSNKLSVGIVGLPNVGKSTLFNALLQKSVADVSNYPFCTIEPNVGIVPVPDKRLDRLAELIQPQEKIPAVVEFIDIAGLVKGAHQGEGLGNQFLAKIREVPVIAQVVRVFEDENTAHVAGQIDPVADIKTIQAELALADLATLARRLEKLKAQARGRKSEDPTFSQIEFLQKVEKRLTKGRSLWDVDTERSWPDKLQLLSFKPQVVVLNVSERQLEGLPRKDKSGLHRIQQEIKALLPDAPVIPICAKLEAELTSFSKEEQKEYRASLGLENLDLKGLEQLIQGTYQLLDLITFYTTQNQILQAWGIQKGSTAFSAAGLIHTDFAQGFIKAEVVPYEQFLEAGSFEKARTQGQARLEGKDYLVQDGDVVYFRVKT